MRIYTKTGDQGETSLFTGKRVSKGHSLVNIFGFLDELNTTVGQLSHSIKKSKSVNFEKELKLLQNLQKHFFSIGSFYASEKQNPEHIKNIDSWVSKVESEIDRLTEALPELKHFILPGGSEAACYAHQSRVQSRKVERDLVDFESSQGEIENQNVIVYLNRISDYFFTLARYLNHELKVDELIWTADGN